MALDKQKTFLFKQLEIITMVLSKLYFLTDALEYFGQDIGLKEKNTDDDAVKYELWRKGISLENYRKDRLCVCFFKDRLNHHSQFQPQIRRIFKGSMKGNPFVHIQIKDWADQYEIFTTFLVLSNLILISIILLLILIILSRLILIVLLLLIIYNNLYYYNNMD